LESRRLLSSTPFHGAPFVANQTIEAEDFDNGGEGVAFHDTTSTDLGAGGSAYRKTAVDVQAGGSNGYDIGYTAVGEWLTYTVNIVKAGTYQLQARVANTASGGAFHVNVGGANQTGTINVPNTGDWQTYQTVMSGTFTLNAGTQIMRVFLDKATAAKAVGNFDSFKLVQVAESGLAWTTVAAAPEGLAEAQSASLNGKLYVFGGYNITSPAFTGTNHAYVYDAAANTWAHIANLPQALTHMGVATDGRYVYIAGGYVTNLTTKQQTFATTNVWRYDPQTNTYSSFIALPSPRGAGAMVYLDGQLHFFGGVDLSRVGHTEHWILNLNDAHPTWTAATPMPFTRNHLAAVVLNDRIYAIGGQEGIDDKIPDPDVLVYWDPSNPNQWAHVADLPAGRSHMAAISTGSHIIVMAGEGTGGVILSSTLEYDPTANTWTPITSMPGPRLAPVGAYINGKIVFSLGYSVQGLQKTTWVSNAIV
jgi:N-acetylneuraminic acid mutarotase